MKLRRRFFSVIGGLAVMASGVSADEPRQIAAPLASPKASTNQQIANEIALAIARGVPNQGYTVSVDFQGGTATLRGTASSPTQIHQIVSAARATRQVSRLVNELTLGDSGSVQMTMYQESAPSAEAMPPSPGMMPGGAGQNLVPAVPEHRFAQGAAPQYDMPFMPPFAWPAKAPYPNYSAVQYPLRYPSKAWPYIGPFHPYPEPPLDWREVKMMNLSGLNLLAGDKEPPVEWQCTKLKWQNGHWYLQFTNPWWTAPQRALSCLVHAENTDPSECQSCCVDAGGYKLWFKQPAFTHMYSD